MRLFIFNENKTITPISNKHAKSVPTEAIVINLFTQSPLNPSLRRYLKLLNLIFPSKSLRNL